MKLKAETDQDDNLGSDPHRYNITLPKNWTGKQGAC